ncbi:MAG: YihY family inner membrane protein [Proteobacteria bacterium]|nr:YihY family inner membrane protein [Pseudomonadota bacterium]
MMMGFSEIPHFIRSRIWGPDLDNLAPWLRVTLRSIRICWAVVRDLHGGELSLRAMSLVYTTILSLVPLLAISFSVLKGFGVHEQLETVLLQTLLPLGEKGVEIGSRIVEFVDNVKVGVLGSVGLALLIYTVISLMQKIERAFNFIWHVSQERPFAQRFSNYLSVILIGPVLVFSSLGVSASLQSTDIVKTLTAIEPFGSLVNFAGTLLPFVLVVGAFTFIYVFMPNTRVKVRSAFAGAFVAGLMWNMASVFFAKFVVSSAQYTAIYSAFAALIIFMLWLYIGWLVLLAGASSAYYHQNPEQVSLIRGAPTLSLRMVERLSFAVLTAIVNHFVTADPRTGADDLAGELNVPTGVLQLQINTLSLAGLIVATADTPPRWMPARAPETIPLSDVMAAIRKHGENPALAFDNITIRPVTDRLLSDIEQRQTEILAQLSLADLVDPDKDNSAPANLVATLRVKGGPGDAAE